MSALVTLIGTGVSLGTLGWLTETDPKRRRTFGLKPAPRTAPRWAWALVLTPGVIVPFWSGAAGFVLWLGAVSVTGWALVSVSPQRMTLVAGRIAGVFTRMAARLRRGRAAGRALTARIGLHMASRGAAPDIETRLAALEAEVAKLRAALAGAAPACGREAELHLVEGARQVRAG